jgi:hypothetical protein
MPEQLPTEFSEEPNLLAHKSAAIVKAIEEASENFLMLPPYSPDFEPIEMMFSKPKEGLRAMSKRSVPSLTSAIGAVLRTVTAKNICGWFRNCGYGYKQKRNALNRCGWIWSLDAHRT